MTLKMLKPGETSRAECAIEYFVLVGAHDVIVVMLDLIRLGGRSMLSE